MPITTPENHLDDYNGDSEHFEHVLEYLFFPAIKNVGLNPISPKASGSEIIHAEIICNLSNSELVLCDMSMLNPNVFFEFGIRTALDKPIALVVDDKTSSKIPFDASIINYHRYDSSLKAWAVNDEIDSLTKHLEKVLKSNDNRNSLWKYFGVKQSGVFNLKEITNGDKIDLLIQMVESLSRRNQDFSTLAQDDIHLLKLHDEMKKQNSYRERLKKYYEDKDIKS